MQKIFSRHYLEDYQLKYKEFANASQLDLTALHGIAVASKPGNKKRAAWSFKSKIFLTGKNTFDFQMFPE